MDALQQRGKNVEVEKTGVETDLVKVTEEKELVEKELNFLKKS